MKKYWCKKCKGKKYMIRKELRKHLREVHWKKHDLRTLEVARVRKIQSWWGEEEWK